MSQGISSYSIEQPRGCEEEDTALAVLVMTVCV